MTTRIVVNSENWPVNVVTVQGVVGQPIEHTAIVELCDVLRAFTRRRAPYANIVDLKRCGSVPPVERQFVAESFNRHREAYALYLVAAAVVLTSPAMRGVLTAIGWVHHYPCPIDFVSSVAVGAQRLQAYLAGRGVVWAGLGDSVRATRSAGARAR